MAFRSLIAAIGGLALGGCSVLGIRSGYEQPAYTVVEQLAEDIEVRRYAPRVAAETTVAGDSERSATGQAFRRLAGYIFGGNQGETDIAMTTPVQASPEGQEIAMTAPVQRSSDGATVTMRFFLPAQYTVDTAPAPNDDRVVLKTLPEETFAAIRFSRIARPVLTRKAEALEQAVARAPAWTKAGEASALFYDPPWTIPFLRRTEVLLPVAPADP